MAFFQTKHVWIKQLSDNVGVLMLDREQSPVNFLDFAMLDDLDLALDAIVKNGAFRLLVIRSTKGANFCTGPSHDMLASWKNEDFVTWAKRGQEVCNRLAELTVPSVCVIAGNCCDAGLELALACDCRVVVNAAATALGFPELEWGMIPCWGGTQRLPRLVGLDNSLHLLLTGAKLDARAAWQFGLADDLVEEVGDKPPSFLENPVKRDWSQFPRRTWRERWLESNRPGRWLLLRGAERIVRTRIPEEMPAQAEMLHAMKIAFAEPSLAPGLEFERQAMERIVGHPALHHLLRLLKHRETMRVSGGAKDSEPGFHSIGIIGSDPVALSLLLHCVTKGHEVVLRGADEAALGTALAQIIQLLQAEVQRGAMPQIKMQKTLGAIRGTYTWTHFDKVDLVLDTTPGSLEQKQTIYREVEDEVPPSALIVPITPSHRVAELRQGLSKPRPMIGVHLVEPWSRTSLAEIAAPPEVAPAQVQRVREWALGLGKCCLQVPDSPGGLAMRVWMPALNEAGLLVKEGVAIERIDQAMRRFGMSHGPCEWMDRLGIDRVAQLAESLQPQFSGRMAFESGFALMAKKGWIGNRSERGFYRIDFRGKKKPHRGAADLWWTQSQGEAARVIPSLSGADLIALIQLRLVTLMVLEAMRCLEEGIVRTSDDLDCALCLTGWATHRGGPIGYARDLGAEILTAQCEQMVRELGLRFVLPVTSIFEN